MPPTAPAPADRETWSYGIRLALRLATAHHPLCSWFQSDRYHLFGASFCRGCTATIPLFALGIIAFPFAIHFFPAGVIPLAALALALGIPHGTTYLHRFSPAYRATAKLLGGFGLGLLIPAILFVPVPLAYRILVLAGLGVAFLLLQAVRMKRMLAVCDACPWQRDWNRCPGFEA